MRRLSDIGWTFLAKPLANLARGLVDVPPRALAPVLDDGDAALVSHHDAELVQELRVAPGDNEQSLREVAAGPPWTVGRPALAARLRSRLPQRVHPLAADPAGNPQPRMCAVLARFRHSQPPRAAPAGRPRPPCTSSPRFTRDRLGSRGSPRLARV